MFSLMLVWVFVLGYCVAEHLVPAAVLTALGSIGMLVGAYRMVVSQRAVREGWLDGYENGMHAFGFGVLITGISGMLMLAGF